MEIQTQFEFTLPRGYIDRQGNVHRHGIMRLATALDEIMPLRDSRVRSNEAYMIIVLLSRVIVKLGTLDRVDTSVIENLFAADFAYLQEFYRRINEHGTNHIPVTCPHCGTAFEVDLNDLGGEV